MFTPFFKRTFCFKLSLSSGNGFICSGLTRHDTPQAHKYCIFSDPRCETYVYSVKNASFPRLLSSQYVKRIVTCLGAIC